MSPSEHAPLVAMVVMRPASGGSMPAEPITVATLSAARPDAEEAVAVSRALGEAGFEVGPLVGVAMSIAGPRNAFERFFGIEVAPAEDGGWVARASGRASREFPLDALPETVAGLVHAITFEPPAEPVGGDAVTP